MPTGYTAPLYDGDPITFEQFVLRCARGMGATIHQRDDSTDDEPTLRTMPAHYGQQVDKALAALHDALTWDEAAWTKHQNDTITAAREYRNEYVARHNEIGRRYRTMLACVRDWQPPTADHYGLREFMHNQLKESIEFDVGHPGTPRYEPPVPEILPIAEYRAKEVQRLTNDLERAATAEAEEWRRVRTQNEWINALRTSLGLEPLTPKALA